MPAAPRVPVSIERVPPPQRVNIAPVRRHLLLLVTTCAMGAFGCGAALSPQRAREELRTLRHAPVSSGEEAAKLSARLDRAVQSGVLDGMRRPQVEQLLGRGEPCSRMPECTRRGLAPNDLYYVFGDASGYPGRRPVLLVAFDRFDRVERTWTIRVEH